MDHHANVDVVWMPVDVHVELRTEAERTGGEIYESPGYPEAIGSYALSFHGGVLYREDITAIGGHMYPVVDETDLKKIGII
jgi:hypothetical protein